MDERGDADEHLIVVLRRDSDESIDPDEDHHWMAVVGLQPLIDGARNVRRPTTASIENEVPIVERHNCSSHDHHTQRHDAGEDTNQQERGKTAGGHAFPEFHTGSLSADIGPSLHPAGLHRAIVMSTLCPRTFHATPSSSSRGT